MSKATQVYRTPDHRPRMQPHFTEMGNLFVLSAVE